MYGGHIALGISAKRWAPIVPLWLLVVASQSPDWVDVVVCSTQPGIQNHAMLSHSLPAVGFLIAIAALTGRYIYGSWYVGKILGLVVASHLAGDYVTGVKPTWPNGPDIGLRLYSRPILDFLFEAAVITWGWWMYRSTFRPARRNSAGVKAMLVGLILLQAIAATAFVIVPLVTKCG